MDLQPLGTPKGGGKQDIVLIMLGLSPPSPHTHCGFSKDSTDLF